ncbi:MAG: cadmium-translocating P-type ATPase [Abditibacteriota bacterium]|nr:cadmium-translocating P-type ATPase [Abditibacteriota bacterium]
MRKLLCELEELTEIGGVKKDIACLILSGISLCLSLAGVFPGSFDFAWVAIILCGLPIIIGALAGLLTRFDVKADLLVAAAVVSALIIGERFAAGEVAFIMGIGELLEEITAERAKNGIKRLIDLTPRTARLITGGGEEVVPAEAVKAGNIIRVLPGETVPADGVIISGETCVNQAVMTGESVPEDKTVGDSVMSGTVNMFGAFDMEASRDGKDSSVRRMIDLVRSADANKAEIVTLADKWATLITVAAFIAALAVWVFTGDFIRGVTVLVVFCPCAFVLATPTAVTAAMGNAAKFGFLVKEGDALERLAAVTAAAFDKTGTLTLGTPEVRTVKSFGKYAFGDVYAFAACAEKLSEHPLGKAVVKCYGKDIPDPESFEMIPGKGVVASVGGKRVLAGSRKFLTERGIDTPDVSEEAGTLIFVAADGEAVGYISLFDRVRPGAAEMIGALANSGVEPVLITGDRFETAAAVSRELEIDKFFAECMPEDKLRCVDKAGKKVCMVGDGVNDAPALRKAYVGIAMSGAGSDIAAEAADIALINDAIDGLPRLIRLSRAMMTTVKVNLIVAMAINFAAVVLAAMGVLGPVAGALVHNGGSVAVIFNSALLLTRKN